MTENTKQELSVQRLIRRSLRIVQLRTAKNVLRKSRYILATVEANVISRKYIPIIEDEIDSQITELAYWNARDINELIASNEIAKAANIPAFEKFWLSSSDLKHGFTIIDGKDDSVVFILCVKPSSFVYTAGDFVRLVHQANVHKETDSCLRKSDISIIDFGRLVLTRKTE